MSSMLPVQLSVMTRDLYIGQAKHVRSQLHFEAHVPTNPPAQPVHMYNNDV